jgi:hypothetical protein
MTPNPSPTLERIDGDGRDLAQTGHHGKQISVPEVVAMQQMRPVVTSTSGRRSEFEDVLAKFPTIPHRIVRESSRRLVEGVRI